VSATIGLIVAIHTSDNGITKTHARGGFGITGLCGCVSGFGGPSRPAGEPG